MSPRPFTSAEYAERIAGARRQMGERGIDALLVWGRGGGALDRCANLVYLADHYPGFPTIPDAPGIWRDEGFAAALVTRDDVILITARPTAEPDQAVATDVIASRDLVAATVEQLRRRGLERGSIGLVGGDALTHSQGMRLAAGLEDARLVDADEVLYALRAVKSPAEQELLRAAGAVGATAMAATMERVEAGRTQAELAATAAASILAEGGVPYNLFVEAYGAQRAPERHSLSVDDAAEPLAESDVFTIDMSGAREGYLFDFSRSRVVSAEATAVQRELLDLTRTIVDAVVAELRPGRTAGDAGAVGARMLAEHGHPLAEQEFPALGHGLGLGFEPPYLTPGDSTPIRPGMCFAVERRINVNGHGATFERNVLVTEHGPELLSDVPDEFPTE